MRSLRLWRDRVADEAADRLLAWTAAHTRPAEREWLEAMCGELASLDSGPSRLAWALGGPRLAWMFTWRWQMLRELRRASLGVSWRSERACSSSQYACEVADSSLGRAWWWVG
jgi:hypothetical protein